MNKVYSSKNGWLINIFLLMRGVLLWRTHCNKPFDSANYTQNYGCVVTNTEGLKQGKIFGKSKNYPQEKHYTRISGVWLRFPKLHYYTFNWEKDARVSQELKHWKNILHESMRIRLHEGGAVLLVLHELSRTGAPILGVELAKRVLREANVIVISLKEGPLEEVLKELGIPVFVIDWENELIRNPMLEMILQEGNVNRAVVNSICSYPVIDALSKRQIPIVGLVHEFSSYVAFNGVFPMLHDASVAVFYPAPLVAEDAYRGHPLLGKKNVRVLPQGLIKAPSTSDARLIASEMHSIRKIFHDGDDQDVCVVLGVGTIEPRKGVDLFISTAQAILRTGAINPFRFVWIGNATNPSHRYDYLVHLREQIRRGGLSDHVYIMDPLQNLQAAFVEADLFFLSSRLDPLPLVSLEAMEHGLPLVCFEGASGIADYIQEFPEISSTVVPYLDTEMAARRIRELIGDSHERVRIGLNQQAFSRKRFDMDAYTKEILSQFETN